MIPKYPSVKRDFSIVVDQLVSWDQVEKIIHNNSDELLTSIELFDLYQGKQISKNQKSFAFSLTYQSVERTLTENEVESSITKVLLSLKSKINAELRV